MSEHTPTPWEVDVDFDYDLCFTEDGEPMSGWQIYGPKSWPVAAAWVEGIVDRLTGRANAEFIVKAVNSHDRLVEALENALNGIDAALVDVRAARRRGNIDPGLEAAEYNLSHLTNDVVAALAAARGEGE